MIIVTNSDIMGKNIAFLRRKLGYTRAELSALCGTEELELRDIEQGEVFEIEAEELRALCRIFQVDMERLVSEPMDKE